MKRIVLLVALVAASAHLAHGQVSSDPPAVEDARAAIEANHRKFIGAFGKGDAAAVTALHAADARVLPEQGRPVEGAQEIEAFWQGVLKAGARLVQLQTLSVEERGELACEVGDYMMTMQSSPGVTEVHSGNYVVVWRREGAEWKVAAAIWNASKEAAGR